MQKYIGGLGVAANTILTTQYFDNSGADVNALAYRGFDKSSLTGAIIMINDLFYIEG